MKRITILSALLLLTGTKIFAQYYYQDIYNTQQTIANMALLKENKVKAQSVQSLDANQEMDNDFTCLRLLGPGYRQMRSITRSGATGLSIMTTSFSTKGTLTKTTDSTNSSISTVQYQYNDQGQLQHINTISQAREGKFRVDESRAYQYDSLGHLARMIQKKGNNATDSTIITFKTNDKGQVTEELESGKNTPGKRIYYNYDASGRLTDIFRYHPSRKKMLPDYIFEYNAQNKLSKMTTVNMETSSYTIWKYNYLSSGLPDKEECYGKGNELLGIIKYKYEMNP
jgi:YD repeat-containing protein